jgi:MoxR-like ATPase
VTELTAEKYPEEELHYERVFNPRQPQPPAREAAMRGGDRARQSPYAYDESIILAVNTAIAANRPLLVAGRPGTGKSALASDIATQLDSDPTFPGRVAFVQTAITGRTEGRDLLWRFDTVRRLRDAQLAAVAHAQVLRSTHDASGRELAARAPSAADPLAAENYVAKGVLWEAFAASNAGVRMVVLIDEIDKADPDVPNSLLEVLGSGRFGVDELDEGHREIAVDDNHAPIIVITTNGERELSRPFRRRCVTLTLRPPNADRLLEIATAQGLASASPDREIATALASEVERLSKPEAGTDRLRSNAAEYLDALRTCLHLGVTSLDSVEWKAIKDATLVKPPGPDDDFL